MFLGRDALPAAAASYLDLYREAVITCPGLSWTVLAANGAGRGGRSLYEAVFRYNHAHWYVRNVLSLAGAYARQYA